MKRKISQSRDHISISNLEALRLALIEFYSSHKDLHRLFDNTSVPVQDSYINLSILESHKQRKIESKIKNIDQAKAPAGEENLIWKEECMPSHEELFEVKSPIQLSALFDAEEKQEKPAKLLIQGRAGIGKSVLCQYLAVRWALNNGNSTNKEKESLPWLEKFKAVFWIKLRDMLDLLYGKRVEQGNLECVISKLCLEGCRKIDLTVFLNSEENCSQSLFILDGFDEIASSILETQNTTTAAVRDVWAELLRQPHIIVTSRPIEFSFWRNRKDVRQLEIMGFTNENIENYVYEFINSSLTEEAAETKPDASLLLKYLKSHPSAWGVAHIPINLEMLCWLYVKGDFKPKASTLSQLYKEMVEHVINEMSETKSRSRKKRAKYPSLMEVFSESCSKKVRDMGVCFLEVLAYEAMRKNELLISSKTFKDVAEKILVSHKIDESDIYSLTEKLVECSHQLGFLKTTQQGGYDLQEQSHYFIHLSFQEFFAAQYVAKQLASEDFQSERATRVEHLKENKYNPRYQLMWWLTAGLLNLRAQKSNNFNGLKVFWETLDSSDTLEPSISVEHDQLTIHCLDECLIEENRQPTFKEHTRLLEQHYEKINFYLNNINQYGAYLNALNRYYSSFLRCSNVINDERILQLFIKFISQRDFYYGSMEILVRVCSKFCVNG